MSAWIFQLGSQVEKHGSQRASWYVGWFDPAGKKKTKTCGPGVDGKRNAEKLKKKVEAELLTGTYQSNSKKTWAEFRQEFETKIADGMLPRSRQLVMEMLNTFERIVKPVRIWAIKTQTIDEFRAKRREEPGKKE